jgi:PadR family transcriptional regulator, regulatory protein AphA
MSLEYAILGFLNYQPFSGYDLKKVFDQSIRHFWPADQSQIYRTLAQLSEKGWVEMEVVPQVDRPDRKVYHITAVGRDEFERWLAGPIPNQEFRSAALIKVFFSGQLKDEQILEEFKAEVNYSKKLLERYNDVPNHIEDIVNRINSPRELVFWMATLELGKKTTQANIEWAEDIIRMIEKKELPPE